MIELGPVRKWITGDKVVAVRYYRVARVLLGQIKDQMRRFKGHQASRKITLPGGVEVTANYFYGIQDIKIHVPELGGELVATNHGIVCIPASDEVTGGWGFPYEDAEGVPINAPLGTEGGTYPKVIYFEGDIKRSSSWYNNYSADLIVGKADWQNTDASLVLSWQARSRYFNDSFAANLDTWIARGGRVLCSSLNSEKVIGAAYCAATNQLLCVTWVTDSKYKFYSRVFNNLGYDNDDIYRNPNNLVGWRLLGQIAPTDTPTGGSIVAFNISGTECVFVTKDCKKYFRVGVNTVAFTLSTEDQQDGQDVDASVPMDYIGIDGPVSYINNTVDTTGDSWGTEPCFCAIGFVNKENPCQNIWTSDNEYINTQTNLGTSTTTYSTPDLESILAADYIEDAIVFAKLKTVNKNIKNQTRGVVNTTSRTDYFRECKIGFPNWYWDEDYLLTGFASVHDTGTLSSDDTTVLDFNGEEIILDGSRVTTTCNRTFEKFHSKLRHGDLFWTIDTEIWSGTKVEVTDTVNSAKVVDMDLRIGYLHVYKNRVSPRTKTYTGTGVTGASADISDSTYNTGDEEIIAGVSYLDVANTPSNDSSESFTGSYNPGALPATNVFFNTWGANSSPVATEYGSTTTSSGSSMVSVDHRWDTWLHANDPHEATKLGAEELYSAEQFSVIPDPNNHFIYSYSEADLDTISEIYTTDKRHPIEGVF